MICYHTLPSDERWISGDITHPSSSYTTARAYTIVMAHQVQQNAKYIQNEYERLKWKMPFADTRITTIISQNSQNLSVCLEDIGKKNTVKRWIEKCLHQCNFEIETRDLTEQFYQQPKFFSKVAKCQLKLQMLIRVSFKLLSHTHFISIIPTEHFYFCFLGTVYVFSMPKKLSSTSPLFRAGCFL